MPRKYKKKTRKRAPPRRARRRAVPMGMQSGLPKVRRTSQRYVDTVSMSSTFGSMEVFRWRANGAWDPSYTGGGHQPMGWDQMAAQYNHYVVVGAKISAKWMRQDFNTDMVCGVYLSDDATIPYPDYTGFVEARRGTHRSLGYGSDGKTPTVVSKFSAKKFFNITDIKDNFDRLGSLTNTTPGEQCIFNLWVQDLDPLHAVSASRFIVTIDYIIDWSEPKDLSQS